MTTEQGTLLGARYQLGPVLGRGGMAEVRRALDTRLNRSVAIKQLRQGAVRWSLHWLSDRAHTAQVRQQRSECLGCDNGA